jgi:hypothetical protein
MTRHPQRTWRPRGLAQVQDRRESDSLNMPVVLRVLGRRRALRQRDRWTREQLQA